MTINLAAALSAATSVIAIGMGTGAAYAQTPVTPTNVAQAPDEAATTGEDILVTGTRIARPEVDFPSPVESFSAAEIQRSGDSNLTEFLLKSPALAGSLSDERNSGSNTQNGGPGVNLLDLRNLGTVRTLVLVNGRRHVGAFPGENSVDINTIPQDLIERVDILTGGASAIYGADAVSGVVNFVLKRHFQGLNIRGQAGVSGKGDAADRLVSLVAGTNFAGDRGNVVIAYEFRDQDRLSQRDRAYTGDPAANYQLLRDPADVAPDGTFDDPNRPDRILFNGVSWADSARNGAVVLDVASCFDPDIGICDPVVDGDGRPYDRGTPLAGTGGRAVGSTSNTPTAGYFGDFRPKLTTHNVNLLFNFDLSDAVRFFAEGKYVKSRAFTEIQPSFDFFSFLAPDNYYLQQRFGAAAPDGALVSRDNFDLGINNQTADRDTYRGVIGVEGDLTHGENSGNLHYELSYVYGRADSRVTSGNSRLTDRYYAALDAVVDPATGQVTCRINLPGETTIDPDNYAGILTINGQPVSGAPLSFQPGQCRPITILGYGQSSEAGRQFVFVDDTTLASSTQQVVSATLSGDLGFAFSLPGGPVGFAIGGEYRKETTRSTPSAFQQGGFFDGGNQVLPSRGSYDVKEVYGELNAPVLSHLPLAENLSFGGAFRYSSYSTIGSTFTWKVDGSYAPVKDIEFRATYSKAVRAPNINELFQPLQGVQAFLDDPCDPLFLPEGTQYRAANCVAQLTAAGLTPAQIAAFSPATDPKQSTSQPGLQGGNPNLKEETAKTWTAGVVLRPRFIPGLAITADWYDIKLSNAINTPDQNDLFKLCVDQPTLDNPFCGTFTRSSTTGFINSFVVSAQNVAGFNTSGLELTVNYDRSLSDALGSINVHLVGGYLNDLTRIATIGGVPEQRRNWAYYPEYQGKLDVTWHKGPVSFTYGLDWQGKTKRWTNEQLAGNPDISDRRFFFYKERWDHSIAASVEVDKRFELYGGVNNLADQQPAIAATSGGTEANAGFPIGPVGRFFFLGAKIKLDRLF